MDVRMICATWEAERYRLGLDLLLLLLRSRKLDYFSFYFSNHNKDVSNVYQQARITTVFQYPTNDNLITFKTKITN